MSGSNRRFNFDFTARACSRSTATARAVQPPSAAGLDGTVQAAKVRLSYAAPWGTLASGMVTVALVTLAMSYVGSGWTFAPTRHGVEWALLTALTVLSRLGISCWLRRAALSDDETVRAGRFYVWNGAVAGAAWGSSSWLLLPAHVLQQEGFLLVAMAMVMMGGVGGQIAHRSVVLAFCITVTTTFATGLLRFADPPHVLLALGYLPFAGMLVLYARKQERAVSAAIELSLRNTKLLALKTREEHTARQAQQAAEEARQHAERADRGKTAFIAAASHDLRQPMHALIQYVAHLRGLGLEADARRTLGKIDESVQAIEELLNAVLDFSKMSMGAIVPLPRPTNVRPLLARVDTQVRPLALHKGLALVVEPIDAWMDVDDLLLERIVTNIAHNAVRYTAAGTVRIRASARRGAVRIVVGDSGIGIPAGERARIFDEYYQVDNVARDRRKGLGLGLAIVRNLAELMKLRVRVRSRVGVGSTFAVEVPRASAPAVPAAQGGAAMPGIDLVRGALIVLIDDDPLILDGVGTTLRDFGCRVVCATSGAEAAQALRAEEFAPQLVVSDLRLRGGESGLDAIGRLAAAHADLYGEGHRLRSIVISGDTSPAELQRVREAGYPMLHKPVSAERLHAAINAELRMSAAFTGGGGS